MKTPINIHIAALADGLVSKKEYEDIIAERLATKDVSNSG